MEQPGNPDAAQDLYGLGVRVGVYLQALGMILYNYGDKEDYGKGLKVASGSITLSILASWYVFAARAVFSPSEAVIVLLVLMSVSFPAKMTLLNPRTIVGETIGLIALLLPELATCAALVWTFARLVDTLPALQTPGVMFFFAKVSLHGWFRYLALVYCIIDALTSLSFAYKVARVTTIAWNCYKEARKEASQQEEEQIGEIIRWDDLGTTIRLLRWLIWVLEVVAVELTVRWNHLSPTSDLQAPGQLIPLVTGVIILIDSAFVAGRRVAPHWAGRFFGFIAAAVDGVTGGVSSCVRLFQDNVPLVRKVVRRRLHDRQVKGEEEEALPPAIQAAERA